MTNISDKASGMAASPSDELAALIAKYRPALTRYFARNADASSAEDLVQEVFLRLQARAQDAAVEDVERFLFTVAKRVLIDRRRFEARRNPGPDFAFEDGFDAPDDLSPERILSAKQEVSRALVAISALPPRMRTALVLHRFGKLSFSAIAARMGIRKGSVQVLIQRAIERITKELGNGDER